MTRLDAEKFLFHFAGVVCVVMVLACGAASSAGRAGYATLFAVLAGGCGGICRSQHRTIKELESIERNHQLFR